MNIQWKPEKRKVQDLKLWDRNPRKITKENFDRLKARIVERGMHDVLKIDLDNTVLSGNQRKQALVDLGVEEVFVMVPDRKLTDVERDQVALESNRNDGTDDFDMLANFDEQLLRDIGFSDEELIVGFGLSRAGQPEMDLDRLAVLQVDPPEAPPLKERVTIKFDNFSEFEAVKAAVESGKITAQKIAGLL